MSAKAKLTPEFIAALISWQDQGDRSINIELSKNFLEPESKLKIWVYDYNLVAGEFVSCTEEIPTEKMMLLQQKKDLDASHKRLNKQLKALEV